MGDHHFLLPEATGYEYGEKRGVLLPAQDKGALEAEAALRGNFPEQFHSGLILESVLQASVSL